MKKSTPDEIKERFDNDVERFSNLEKGQESAVDSALALRLIAEAASASTPRAHSILDIGCGAGNYTLKLLSQIPDADVTLIDLSLPMLQRAEQRVRKISQSKITTIQGDIRNIKLKKKSYDIIICAAVLHHLRSDKEWKNVFRQIYNALRPGGSFWIFDLIVHETDAVEKIMKKRYSEYLTSIKNKEFRDFAFSIIEMEDTPRSLDYQVSLLKKCGFLKIEILHKNSCYAAFGAVK